METKAEFLSEINEINKNYNTDLIGRAFDTLKIQNIPENSW